LAAAPLINLHKLKEGKLVCCWFCKNNSERKL